MHAAKSKNAKTRIKQEQTIDNTSTVPNEWYFNLDTAIYRPYVQTTPLIINTVYLDRDFAVTIFDFKWHGK